MVIPSLACQASCTYCFGPHRGAVMDERTAVETVAFIRDIATETAAQEISIVFHGGEPLLAPIAVWRVLLEGIKSQLEGYSVKLSVQSNLWNLNDEFLGLFRENGVAIGTSMDGTKELCDINRGDGYFDKTNSSLQKAAAAGFPVSAIATITKQTLPYAQEIAKYFRDNSMPLVLHGALAGMDDEASPFALSAGEYAAMVKGLYPWYVQNRKYTQIDTLDHFVRGIATGSPGVCTLRDCFGMFLSISPTGDIASCQRLSGREGFSMGNVFDRPTLAQLYESPAARRQLEREAQCAKRCSSCEFCLICKGGCYYNAVASGDGIIDPWCEAYRDIYAFVQDRVMAEMQSPENIEALSARPAEPDEHPLLRKGAYISLAGKVHPARIADNARRILAIHEMGRTHDLHAAAQSLYDQGICGNPGMTEKLLEGMREGLYRRQKSRNNCYAHVTFDCNLHCKHCYAT
ncbi:MAG: SPASM domain-containing protein, partial [Eggerthellaceae bacterium]|nr:SPASM domain-containing protein [Eggerthellaceae bacterium]